MCPWTKLQIKSEQSEAVTGENFYSNMKSAYMLRDLPKDTGCIHTKKKKKQQKVYHCPILKHSRSEH